MQLTFDLAASFLPRPPHNAADVCINNSAQPCLALPKGADYHRMTNNIPGYGQGLTLMALGLTCSEKIGARFFPGKPSDLVNGVETMIVPGFVNLLALAWASDNVRLFSIVSVSYWMVLAILVF